MIRQHSAGSTRRRQTHLRLATITAARAHELYEHLVEYGADSCFGLREDLVDWTREDIDEAIDALVADGLARLVPFDGFVEVEPVIWIETAA